MKNQQVPRPPRARSGDFADLGYHVSPLVLTPQTLRRANALVEGIIDRFRAGDRHAAEAGVSIAEVTGKFPERNPGVKAHDWLREPFIVGDLIALEPGFAKLFSSKSLWECAARLLQCPTDQVIFHFSNLTRNPPGCGPAVGRHRDSDNRYCRSVDLPAVRLLIPMQPMSAENGGTYVIPRSHDADAPTFDAICHPIVPAGGCLGLDAKVLHGSCPNRSSDSRDVLVIQFGVASAKLVGIPDEKFALSDRQQILDFAKHRAVPAGEVNRCFGSQSA
jgi:ectoine hydroxylase-related dioxygenase (phytanoyl-CoA dioxygenase family)